MKSSELENKQFRLSEENAEEYERCNNSGMRTPSPSAKEGPPPPPDPHGEESDQVTFFPPVYLQRYGAVKNVLQKLLEDPEHADKETGCTVLEVGCAEFGLHVFLKSLIGLGKIMYMDINDELLKNKVRNLQPLPVEFILKLSRPKPLVVEAYAGDISQVDPKILNLTPKVWAVVGIEIVEHLQPDVLRKFEENVFGAISPKVVVITTPNSDLNVIFNLKPGEFRHWDHKFEWSREEFKTWCDKICTEFPEYSVSISGIGEGPPETKNLGCVSQMAVFIKKTECDRKTQIDVPYGTYNLIESVTYPNFVETRSLKEIIIDDLNYTINNFWLSNINIERCMEQDTDEYKHSLTDYVNFFINSKISRVPELSAAVVRSAIIDGGFDVREENGEEFIVVNIPLWEKQNESESDDEENSVDDDNGYCKESESIINDFSRCSVDSFEESWE